MTKGELALHKLKNKHRYEVRDGRRICKVCGHDGGQAPLVDQMPDKEDYMEMIRKMRDQIAKQAEIDKKLVQDEQHKTATEIQLARDEWTRRLREEENRRNLDMARIEGEKINTFRDKWLSPDEFRKAL